MMHGLHHLSPNPRFLFNAWAGAQLSVCFLKASQAVVTYSQSKEPPREYMIGRRGSASKWRLFLGCGIKEKSENMEIFLFAFVILYVSFFPNEHILKFKTKPEKY